MIQLSGNPEPTLFADLDPALVAKSEPREPRAAFLELVAGSKMNWVIVSAPTEGWARQVFGEPDVERLWGAVATATRLDEPDPWLRGRTMPRRSSHVLLRSTTVRSTPFASAALEPI